MGCCDALIDMTDERDALRAENDSLKFKVEMFELSDVAALQEQVNGMREECNKLFARNKELEAVIKHMEKQEPVAWQNLEKPMEFYEHEHLDPMWQFMYRPLYTHPAPKEQP